MSPFSESTLEYHRADDEVVCFLHIPKAGGTTLQAILQANFSKSETLRVPFWHFIADNVDSFAPYRFLSGHFFYAIQEMLSRKPIWITMLRDPVKRAISQYQQLQRASIDPNEPKPRYYGVSFEEFLADRYNRNFIENFQTRALSSVFDRPLTTPADTAQAKEKEWSLERAKERLAGCANVGILEQFDDSMNLLTYTFGWRPQQRYQVLNVAPSTPRKKRDEIRQELIDQIIAYNQLDLELYEYGKTLLNERLTQIQQILIERYGETCGLQPGQTPDSQELYCLLDAHYRQRFQQDHPKPAHRVAFDFFDDPAGSGWHPGETNENYRLRWTGPENEMHLDFHLDTDAPKMVRFDILQAATPDILREAKLAINGQSFSLEPPPRITTPFTFQTVLPRRLLRQQPDLTRLTFQTPRTVPVTEINPQSDDERLIGLALSNLVIEPLPATDTIDLTPRQIRTMPHQGWHKPEQGEVHAWIWTGPQTISTLDLPLKGANDLRFEGYILNALAPDILESLRLEAEGQPVPLETISSSDGMTIVQASIPRKWVNRQEGLTRLTLKVNRTLSAHEINPAQADDRPLGVAFARIQISPVIQPSIQQKMVQTGRRGLRVARRITRRLLEQGRDERLTRG